MNTQEGDLVRFFKGPVELEITLDTHKKKFVKIITLILSVIDLRGFRHLVFSDIFLDTWGSTLLHPSIPLMSKSQK